MARFKFSKVYQHNGESVDIFYKRILKTAKPCEFPGMEDCIIDAIIFRTNCVKAQDKLLQTPKTLLLQKCLSVVRHYESLKMHIQQIRPDRNINYLRWHHSSKKKGSMPQNQGSFNTGQSNQNQHWGCSQSHSGQGQNQNQQKATLLHTNQFFGCGQDRHQDKSECPAFGKTCHKCGRSNHFVSVCGKIPYRRSFRSKSQGRQTQTSVNKLNQNNHDSGVTLTSIARNTEYRNVMNTVPKQVLDVVNMANKCNSGKNLQHHLELDTLSTTPMKSQPTQIFFQYRDWWCSCYMCSCRSLLLFSVNSFV